MTNKGLSSSYDERDSGPGKKGVGDEEEDYRPPRYVNHEPFNSGPPTYNSHDERPYDRAYDDDTPYDTQAYNHPQSYDDNPQRDAPRSRDPYVGHQNTAYDGEPEPEGRKYSRGRARSNRTDRLNSSRSTEDGSVVHGLGDVNVGTAI